MVNDDDMGNMLKDLTEMINSKDRTKRKIKEWVGTYYGKIISWNFGKKSFHIVFMKDGSVKFGEGEYPASETVVLTNPETWVGVCSLKTDFRKASEENKLWLRGNFHEMIKFQEICGKFILKLAQKY
ncbi:MAG: hypothetical protein ACTSRG_06945 [Candidatus Helarchaeota archaeon]